MEGLSESGGEHKKRAPERERHGRRNDTLMTGTMNLFFFLLLLLPLVGPLPLQFSKGIDDPSSHGR